MASVFCRRGDTMIDLVVLLVLIAAVMGTTAPLTRRVVARYQLSTDARYSGLIYGHSQGQVSGTPIVDGHVLCYDAPNDPGTEDYVTENKINGTPKITYDCTGMSRLTFVSSWWESRAP